jgi:hypothetical protein
LQHAYYQNVLYHVSYIRALPAVIDKDCLRANKKAEPTFQGIDRFQSCGTLIFAYSEYRRNNLHLKVNELNRSTTVHPKNSFLFWQRWLFYSSLLFALAGIVFAVYGNNPVFMPYNLMLARIFWNEATVPDYAEPFRAFIWGPLGSTIACCYLLLAYLAWHPFRKKQRWARNAIVVAFGTWIVLDSALCIYYGVYPQLYVINALSLVQKSLPLIFTWNDFKGESLDNQDKPT